MERVTDWHRAELLDKGCNWRWGESLYRTFVRNDEFYGYDCQMIQIIRNFSVHCGSLNCAANWYRTGKKAYLKVKKRIGLN